VYSEESLLVKLDVSVEGQVLFIHPDHEMFKKFPGILPDINGQIPRVESTSALAITFSLRRTASL
jgi:hypothetical protein